MHGPHDVIGLGALPIGMFIAGLVAWRIVVWIRNAPLRPDPWDAAIEQGVHDHGAVLVCHRCFTPVSPAGWFCEHCGSAVGPYNNVMPYVRVFSEGEVFRNGVTDRLHVSSLIVIGYVLYSLISYIVFAPVYWFFLFKNLKRSATEDGSIASLGNKLV